MTQAAHVAQQLKALPEVAQKNAVVEVLKSLSDEDQKDVAKKAGISPPTQGVADKIWRIVVWAFAIVMVGSFLTLAVGVFQTATADTPRLVTSDIVVSMFTAAVGFFAGLFAKSPTQG